MPEVQVYTYGPRWKKICLGSPTKWDSNKSSQLLRLETLHVASGVIILGPESD